jgi:hypothetical protein
MPWRANRRGLKSIKKKNRKGKGQKNPKEED